MIVVISPSKTQDFSLAKYNFICSEPKFYNEIMELITVLNKTSIKELKILMSISDNLAKLNFDRYQQFETKFTKDNSKPAILSFKGDVYDGIDVDHYHSQDFDFAQQHLRILSGLYGLVRPLDLIQPYRLEMGIKLKTAKNNNLYQFWGNKITNELNHLTDNNKCLINLASTEYFDSVNTNKLTCKKIDIIFKEEKDDNYKIVGLFSKKARGSMTNFIIKNKITKPELLKSFGEIEYKFNQSFSNENQYVFTRKLK